jgi:hypothetical protein
MDYSQSFLNVANTYLEFKEAVEIIKKNTEGKAWLIGGFVFRAIVEDVYNIPISKDVDFDFIVEIPKDISLPHGWRIDKNSYGNPKFIGPSYEIDYVPLNNIHSIIRRGLEPTIDNFFSGAPLNIQSIAYDVMDNKVVGNIGIKAIKDKTISINNMEQALHRAQIKGVKLRDLITDVANQLDFIPNYDSILN